MYRCMKLLMWCLTIAVVGLLGAGSTVVQVSAGFIKYPYVQRPTQDGMTVMWVSDDPNPGTLQYGARGYKKLLKSKPVLVPELSGPEAETIKDKYLHQVRLSRLSPNTMYLYRVNQDGCVFESHFRTAPWKDSPIRLIVYGDSETEPESVGKPAKWPSDTDPNRRYIIDQDLGYRNNLTVIRERQPDLILIAGDLVESGGEQRDWDEFWRHNGDPDPDKNIAGRIPIMPALGNHEYYGGPGSFGGYNQPYSEQAVAKYEAYFDLPSNDAENLHQRERYYRFDYGPATFIVLDVNNQSPNESIYDTNFFLLGENDPGGGNAPDWRPGSRQYDWLEEQLADAQENSYFTFVIFHQSPYSVGPHGKPAGFSPNDPLSGVPVRELNPLFQKYGVDVVFSGHDEMFERSEVGGIEVVGSGDQVSHGIHYYDVGVGGDDLRGPVAGVENPFQEFLAHHTEDEKHYGHLEADIVQLSHGVWQATLKPVYILPKQDENGDWTLFERRVYDDVVILRTATDTGEDD